MGLSIEPAAESDAKDLAALYAAVAADLTGRFGGGNWSGSNDETVFRRLIGSHAVSVARESGGLAGALRLSDEAPSAMATGAFTPAGKLIYLLDLAVAPGRQGSGIGRQLLAFSETLARETGHDAIRGDAYDHAVGAGAFYLRCGFVAVGRAAYEGTRLVFLEKGVGAG